MKQFLLRFSLFIFVWGLTACQKASTPISNAPSPTPTANEPAKKATTASATLAPCSVQIWEDENFEDDNDVINGPMESRDMKGMPGANKGDWGDEIDSLKVGSKATVTVWQDEDFKDTSATYGPGTEKTNLRGNPNFGDDIDSMKITCSP